MQLERYGMIVLIAAVLLMSRVFQVSPVQQASEAVFQAMLPIAQWASGLTA
jgi:hypothetical protein